MNHTAKVDGQYADRQTDLEPWHQDDALGPQKRCVSIFQHSTYDGTQHWNALISIGMATNEEKSPLVKEIAAAGSPLNDNYFIDAENLELWINKELAGLCRYRSHGSEDLDDESETQGPLRFLFSLDAVFVRPLYHSLGFGEILSEHLAEQLMAGLLTQLVRIKSHDAGADVVLFADFDSVEGDRFFENLAELIELKIEISSNSLGIPITFSTDSGY
jgi:ribosomal protein S18 acetylase RimI-like enzyme